MLNLIEFDYFGLEYFDTNKTRVSGAVELKRLHFLFISGIAFIPDIISAVLARHGEAHLQAALVEPRESHHVLRGEVLHA